MDNIITMPFLKEFTFDDGQYKNQDEAISALLIEWKKVQIELEELYKKRDQKSTLHGMKKGISLFIHFLVWSNDEPLTNPTSITINTFDYKPVNLEERLAFILSRPHLFHSYRQLSELIMEQEKLFAKKKIIRKASNPKG